MHSHGGCCDVDYVKQFKAPSRYNVTFVLTAAGHIRVSLTVTAESIGQAVLEASKQLVKAGMSLNSVLYYQCNPA